VSGENEPLTNSLTTHHSPLATTPSECVTEDQGDAFVCAQVGEPVPGEHALATDDEVLAKGLDGIEKGVGLGRQIAFEDGLAFGAEDVHEHGSGRPIDAAIELVRFVVVRHRSLLVR
jgi:hypothetical protein